jgi:hypothetical protein
VPDLPQINVKSLIVYFKKNSTLCKTIKRSVKKNGPLIKIVPQRHNIISTFVKKEVLAFPKKLFHLTKKCFNFKFKKFHIQLKKVPCVYLTRPDLI